MDVWIGQTEQGGWTLKFRLIDREITVCSLILNILFMEVLE